MANEGILKELEEELEKNLNEATANNDNSEEIISSYTTKTISADVLSIKYKIETLNKYQQLCKHFKQKTKKYNRIKRSLDLYIMKANEIFKK
ncbi:hypothetical protein Glove_23g221 [Diversispora epigaea]|uniref:Uncharacterized protein n=1 Tax=Diversispora epigaea TaxID=1348612 RepID=A0A397JL83_9GLOM|nr:hypothetical protein Glove_23g221 [Diversispora epigaea]